MSVRLIRTSHPKEPFPRQLFLEPPGNRVGEVRVKVTITNATDAVLADEGRLPEDQVRCCEVDALVDTGAVSSVVPRAVLEAIGVHSRTTREATFADGRSEIVDVSNPILVLVEGRDVIEEALIFGDEVLLGQTVLERTDLLVDCANNRLVPNPSHPNGPSYRV